MAIVDQAYRDRVIADGAVAYWRLGETSGTTAHSEIGSYPGTISGGVTLGQPGALADGNPAMAFHQGTIDIPNGAYQAFGTGPFSVECWFRTSVMPQSDMWLFDNHDGWTPPGVNLYCNREGPQITFAAGDGPSNSHTSVWAVLNFADDQWHHVVGVWQRSPDLLQLYIDGTLQHQNVPAVSSANVTGDRPFRIGTYISNGGGNPDRFFSGSIDELAIYHTALTPAQIANHYALRTAAKFPRAYLQARSGIARSGAVRGNYFLYNVVILLTRTASPGVVETVNISRYVELRTLTIHEAINDEIDTASFTLKPGCPWKPRAGEPIRIGLGTGANALFAGQAMNVRTRFLHGIPDPWFDVSCVDHLAAFDARLVTWEWISQPGATILKDLVARYTSGGFTAAGVDPALPTITISAANYRPSTIVRTITHAAKGGFYITPNRDLMAFTEAGPFGGQLTNPQILTPAVKSLKTFTAIDDAAQIRTRVVVEGQRTETPLPIPAASELTSLPIRDGSMFSLDTSNGGPAWNRPEWTIRFGTQTGIYYFVVHPTNPAQPTGTTVTVAAAPGDVELHVADLAWLLNPEGFGWIEVGNQILQYMGYWSGSDPRLVISTHDGYPGIQAPIAIGATVTVIPFLRNIYGHEWAPYGETYQPIRSQPLGTPVIVQAWKEQGVDAWRDRMTVGDGIHEHILQDGRFSRETCLQRALAELNDFSQPLQRVEWLTYDLNADVGRLQRIQMPVDGYTDLTMQITEVDLVWDEVKPPTFLKQNLPPRRTCRAEVTKRAELLDFIVTDQR